MEEEKRIYKTEAERIEALTGFAGIIPGEPLFVTPPIYREVYPDKPERWPRFKIKVQDGLDFNDGLNGLDGVRIEAGKSRVKRLRENVIDWSGFTDRPDGLGNPIPCTKGADGNLDDKSIRAMKPELQAFLLECINGTRFVSREESEGLKF